MTPRLVTPSADYKDSFVAALREGIGLDQFKTADTDAIDRDFEGWYRERHDLSIPVTLPDGRTTPRVPHSDFWLVDETGFLGLINIRHNVGTETLLKYGGHIGYAVRKGARGNGHGTLMMRMIMPHVRALGLEKVLLTCRDDNAASIRVIEKAGGVLENKIMKPGGENGDTLMRRYWVPVPADT